MLQRTRILLAMAILLLLGGCSTVRSTTSTTAAPSVAAPSAGTATITGQVVSKSDSAPIDKVLVRLAPLYTNEETGKAAFALDTARAPAATSDANGYFAIADIEPKTYVIVVGDDLAIYDIIADGNNLARAFDLKPNKLLNAGVLPVRPDVTKTP